MFKRIALFIATNLAIIVVLSIVLRLLGVDRILDMIRTSVNVTGDLTCSAFIARTEGESLSGELAVG